jgi:hypothetical protein
MSNVENATRQPLPQPAELLPASPMTQDESKLPGMQPPAFAPGASMLLAAANTATKSSPPDKLAAFQSKNYSAANYHPTTNSGLFDVHMDSKTGRLSIKVKVGFNFQNGDATAFKGLKGQQAAWSKEEIAKWKSDMITLIEGRWGGKYHFDNPDFPGYTAFVDVDVEEVNKDWHYRLDVKKIPKGAFRGSSVSHFTDKNGSLRQKNKHFGTFDSEDLQYVNKGGKQNQQPITHEFGHIFGLGDEYNDGKPGITHAQQVKNALGVTLSEGVSDSVMSTGDTIGKAHYVTFLDAIRAVTGNSRWRFKK